MEDHEVFHLYNLVRKRVQLRNIQYLLCQEGIETSQHLFITCKVAQKV